MLSFHTTLQTTDKPAIKSSRPNAAIFSEFTSKQIQAPAERHRNMPLLTELEQFCGCVATNISPRRGWASRAGRAGSSRRNSMKAEAICRGEVKHEDGNEGGKNTNGVEGEIKTCSLFLYQPLTHGRKKMIAAPMSKKIPKLKCATFFHLS
jgi:hypothetical protein